MKIEVTGNLRLTDRSQNSINRTDCASYENLSKTLLLIIIIQIKHIRHCVQNGNVKYARAITRMNLK